MLEIFLIALGFFLILLGAIGAIVPVVPGPPLSYLGLIIIHITDKASFSANNLMITGLVALVIVVIDLILPVIGAKRSGGTRYGVFGASVGLIIGIFFFPPFGIIVGPILGAFLAEMVNGQTSDIAIKSAIGGFVGLFFGVILKLIISAYIAWIAVKEVFVFKDVL